MGVGRRRRIRGRLRGTTASRDRKMGGGRVVSFGVGVTRMGGGILGGESSDKKELLSEREGVS